MIVRDYEKIEISNKDEKFKISHDSDYIYCESNDKDGIIIRPDSIVWQQFNILFSKLMLNDINNVKKYRDYLISITSDLDYVRIALVKRENNFIISVISPLKRQIKISLNSEIGIILLEFYNSIINMDMNVEQITMDGYMYSLNKKNVSYKEVL